MNLCVILVMVVTWALGCSADTEVETASSSAAIVLAGSDEALQQVSRLPAEAFRDHSVAAELQVRSGDLLAFIRGVHPAARLGSDSIKWLLPLVENALAADAGMQAQFARAYGEVWVGRAQEQLDALFRLGRDRGKLVAHDAAANREMYLVLSALRDAVTELRGNSGLILTHGHNPLTAKELIGVHSRLPEILDTLVPASVRAAVAARVPSWLPGVPSLEPREIELVRAALLGAGVLPNTTLLNANQRMDSLPAALEGRVAYSYMTAALTRAITAPR